MNKDFHNRKLNRLKNYDYSCDGFYFITTCIKNREKLFGEIKNDKIILNEFGETVNQQWLWLKQQYSYVELDEFIIMPNHIHGILIIKSNVAGIQKQLIKIKSLSELIGAFKTTSSKLIHKSGLINFSWHRSFYDRIIRNEKELFNIQNYIIDNPKNWQKDRNNQEGLYI